MALTILDLPNEIWAEIFNAGAHEDVASLQRTCRRLRDLCASRIWASLEFSNEDCSIFLRNSLSSVTLTKIWSPPEGQSVKSPSRPPFVFGGKVNPVFDPSLEDLSAQFAAFTFSSNAPPINEPNSRPTGADKTKSMDSFGSQRATNPFTYPFHPPKNNIFGGSTVQPSNPFGRFGTTVGSGFGNSNDPSAGILKSGSSSENLAFERYSEIAPPVSPNAAPIKDVYHSISAVPLYRGYSVEELRFQYYSKGGAEPKEKKVRFSDEKSNSSFLQRQSKYKPTPRIDISGKIIPHTFEANYVPYFALEPTGDSKQTVVYHSISAASEFEHYSAEELRFQDYTMLGIGDPWKVFSDVAVDFGNSVSWPSKRGSPSREPRRRTVGNGSHRPRILKPILKPIRRVAVPDSDVSTPTESPPSTPSVASPQPSPTTLNRKIAVPKPKPDTFSRCSEKESMFRRITVFEQMSLIVKYSQHVRTVAITIADDPSGQTMDAMGTLLGIVRFFSGRSVTITITGGISSMTLLSNLGHSLGPDVNPRFYFNCTEDEAGYTPQKILSQFAKSRGWVIEQLRISGSHLHLDFFINYGRFLREIVVSVRGKTFLLLANKALEFCDQLEVVTLDIEAPELLDSPFGLPDTVTVLEMRYAKIGLARNSQTKLRIYGRYLDMLITDVKTVENISLSFKGITSLHLTDTKAMSGDVAPSLSSFLSPRMQHLYIDSVDPMTLLRLREIAARCVDSICVCVGEESEQVAAYDPEFELKMLKRFYRLFEMSPTLTAKSLVIRPPFLAPRYMAAFTALIKSKMPQLRQLEYLMVFDFLSEPDFSAYEYLSPISELRYAVNLTSPAVTTRLTGDELDRFF